MVSPINIPAGFRGSSDALQGRDSAAVPRQQGVAVDSQLSKAEPAQIRNADDAINLLKASLTQRLERQMGSVPSQGRAAFASPAFEAPSTEQVAQRVLGFVQQRLQAEARAGADTERLNGLLADARAGVEQGFAEAREQIEALGMMNNRLSSDIDDSYNRIQDGLDELGAQLSRPATEAAYRVERAAESLFSFEVTTAEGDRVTVQMAEQRYAGASVAYQSDEGGRSANVVSGFSGRYEFRVEGDLNAGERSALADLMSRVEKVSSRFFDGDIQGAFRKAQDLNLGGDALASFSLSLTSTRIVSASAYESVAQQPSVNSQLRPLGDLAQELQGTARTALDQGVSKPAFQGLMNSLLEDIRQWQSDRAEITQAVDPSLMDEFLSAVIQSMDGGAEKAPASDA